MKLVPATKLDQRKKQHQNILTMKLYQKVLTSMSFFQFMVNLEQSGSWIPDEQSVKLIFPLIITSYLTQSENRAKIPLTNSHTIALSEGTIFEKGQ